MILYQVLFWVVVTVKVFAYIAIIIEADAFIPIAQLGKLRHGDGVICSLYVVGTHV